jgi:hypothetical protein
MIQVRLDGQSIPPDDVSGWQEMTTTLRRHASDMGGLIQQIDVELTFHRETFSQLYNLMLRQGHCGELTISIEHTVDELSWNEIIRGIIYLSDIRFDMARRQATVKVRDDSFYSRINNNRSIEFDLLSSFTKNGIEIKPVPVYRMARMVVKPPQPPPPPPGYGAFEYPVLRVYDVMRFLIACMTDDEIGFESAFLKDTDETALGHLFITTGYALRTKNFHPYKPVLLSFKTLMSELRGLRNIDFIMRHTGTKRIIQVEHVSHWLAMDEMMQIDEVARMEAEQDVSSLYDRLVVGSTLISKDGSWPEDTVRLHTFRQEEFAVAGQCNIDNALTLTGQIIRSSNLIELVTEQGHSSHDDRLFFICCKDIDEQLLRCRSIQAPMPVRYYNGPLLNINIIPSFLNEIPNSLIYYHTGDDPDFKVEVKTPQPVTVSALLDTNIQKVVFDDVLQGPFNTLHSIYRAAVAGRYHFEAVIRWENVGSSVLHGVLVLMLRHYDSTGGLAGAVLDEKVLNDTAGMAGFGPMPHYGEMRLEATFQMQQDEEAAVFFGFFLQQANSMPAQMRIRPGSTFRSLETPAEGVQYFSPKDYPVLRYTINHPLTWKQFRQIVESPGARLVVTSHGKRYTGWIEMVKYNHITSESEIQLLTTIRHATLSHSQ